MEPKITVVGDKLSTKKYLAGERKRYIHSQSCASLPESPGPNLFSKATVVLDLCGIYRAGCLVTIGVLSLVLRPASLCIFVPACKT